jgi:hypothetical protein
VCVLGTGVNNRNYSCACNSIYCFSHVVTFDCGMFVFDLGILFILQAWFVFCRDLCIVI